jgi:hypothetical protein
VQIQNRWKGERLESSPSGSYLSYKSIPSIENFVAQK